MNENLNQQHLHGQIARDANVATEVVKRVMESYQDVIARNLAAGDNVMQTNFLSFHVIEQNERQARNPHSGGTMTIPARRRIKVIISERLLEIVRTGTVEIDGQPVTLRKLPKGAKGIIPIVTVNPKDRKLRVRAPRSRAKKRPAVPKTA